MTAQIRIWVIRVLSRNKNFKLYEERPELFSERRLEKRLLHILELIDDNVELDLVEMESASKYVLTITAACICRSVFHLNKDV